MSETATRCLIVAPEIGRPQRPSEARLAEIDGLARAIDLEVVDCERVRLQKPDRGAYLRSGKVEAIGARMAEEKIELLILDATLTAVQQRNLEKATKAKVLDRTALILEIFGARARTREGVLQVERAALGYQRSRLVRSWTHLERQRGGLGFVGGPGETQIELDRRRIDERMRRIDKELGKVKRTRGLHRKARERRGLFTVSLVGYTNAGKSTLFNALTRADVLAADALFATLDPTTRKARTAGGLDYILSDTVGFVADLPTQLVEAFHATLEEVVMADLVLHVVDLAEPDVEERRDTVVGVLREIGLDDAQQEARVVEIWNKADQLDEEARGHAENEASRRQDVALISARDRIGFADLGAMIEARVPTRDHARAPARDGPERDGLPRDG